MTDIGTPSRRERLRAQMLDEIKQCALDQLVKGGPQAVSLNAIARTLGTTGPALYRYYASRDELMTSLAADGFTELAEQLEDAASRARGPEAQFRAVVAAYRAWATAHPHRYRLLFGSAYGSGRMAPTETVPPSHRSMAVLLDALAALGDGDPQGQGAPAAGGLDRQLADWARSRPGDDEGRPVGVLHSGVLAWTRFHGLVSLEIEGVFRAMGVDAQLLFTAEVDELVTRATGG